jgi:hypothetical protein
MQLARLLSVKSPQNERERLQTAKWRQLEARASGPAEKLLADQVLAERHEN